MTLERANPFSIARRHRFQSHNTNGRELISSSRAFLPCTRCYVNDHGQSPSEILRNSFMGELSRPLDDAINGCIGRLFCIGSTDRVTCPTISPWLTHPRCQMLSEFLRTKQKSSGQMAVAPSSECIIYPSVKRDITESIS